jgi:hypothetical protein
MGLGLDLASHVAPSFIDAWTLATIGSDFPPEFIDGAGISPELLLRLTA